MSVEKNLDAVRGGSSVQFIRLFARLNFSAAADFALTKSNARTSRRPLGRDIETRWISMELSETSFASLRLRTRCC